MGRVNVFIEDQRALRNMGTHVPVRTIRIQGLSSRGLGVADAEGSQVTRPFGQEVMFLRGLSGVDRQVFNETSAEQGSGYFHGDRAMFMRGLGQFSPPVPNAVEREAAKFHAYYLTQEELLDLVAMTLFYRNFIIKSQAFLRQMAAADKISLSLPENLRKQVLPNEAAAGVIAIDEMQKAAQKFLFELGEGIFGFYAGSEWSGGAPTTGTAARFHDINTFGRDTLNRQGFEIREEQIVDYDAAGKPNVRVAVFASYAKKATMSFDEGAHTTLAEDLDAIQKSSEYLSALSENLRRAMTNPEASATSEDAADWANIGLAVLSRGAGVTALMASPFGEAPSVIEYNFKQELSRNMVEEKNARLQLKGITLGSNGKIGIISRIINFFRGPTQRMVVGKIRDPKSGRFIAHPGTLKVATSIERASFKAAEIGNISFRAAAVKAFSPALKATGIVALVGIVVASPKLVQIPGDLAVAILGPLKAAEAIFGNPAGPGGGGFSFGLIVAGLLVVGGIVVASQLSD